MITREYGFTIPSGTLVQLFVEVVDFKRGEFYCEAADEAGNILDLSVKDQIAANLYVMDKLRDELFGLADRLRDEWNETA